MQATYLVNFNWLTRQRIDGGTEEEPRIVTDYWVVAYPPKMTHGEVLKDIEGTAIWKKCFGRGIANEEGQEDAHQKAHTEMHEFYTQYSGVVEMLGIDKKDVMEEILETPSE